jgi:hypothetical protein
LSKSPLKDSLEKLDVTKAGISIEETQNLLDQNNLLHIQAVEEVIGYSED